MKNKRGLFWIITGLLLIVAAPAPAPDLLLVDRLMVRARQQGMKLALIVNKCDLDEGLFPELEKQYAGADCPVLAVSARQERGLEAVRALMQGEMCCFTGQSGVGKSTMINALLGLKLETGEISQKILRGKNTTRHAELILSEGLRVLDTAGFSLLELDGQMDPVTLKDYYPEFIPHEGECRFAPCFHDREPGCAVSQAIAAGEINHERAERYRLQKGDIIFIAPGVSHRPLLPESMPEPYTRDVLWLSTEFVDGCRRLLSDSFAGPAHRSSLLRTAGTRWEYLADLFRSGVTETENGAPGWEAAVIGNTMVLITHLSRAFYDRTNLPLAAEYPDLLERGMVYMEENLSKKITLSDIARHLYVSESTVSQTFRNKMGVSFHQCLTQRRLIEAKRLIQDNTLLENVGQRVGFPDYSTFYRAFKKEYGISPRQYRKLQEEAAPADLTV